MGHSHELYGMLVWALMCLLCLVQGAAALVRHDAHGLQLAHRHKRNCALCCHKVKSS